MKKTASILASTPPFLLTSLLALALSGCAVGPNYVPPVSTMPAMFHNATAQTVQIADPAPRLEAWWRSFNDPELVRIMERVLNENLDLAAALARVDQARAVAHLARAALLPSGMASAQAAAQRQSLESPLGELARNTPGYDRNKTLYDSGAGASWEIDLFGGLQRGSEAAAAEAQAAEAAHLGVRVSVAAEAADAYFRVRGAQVRIALAQDQIKTDADLLDLVELRLKEGLATGHEQAAAAASVAQARASLPSLRTELEVQLNRLDVLMGAQPGTCAAELDAPASLHESNAIPAWSAALRPDDLLRRRPDVMAAERHLAASNARIGAALAEYYPKFSLSALLGFESLNSATPNAANFQPQALAGLRWRLFDFGRIDAEVAQAKGANAEALARYRQALLRATEDVENALMTQAQLDQERLELRSEVLADQRAKTLSEAAYKDGASSLMDVLEQDRQLLLTRDQMARADTNAARAAVGTFRAMGGGW
jgi:NodT family efflux transporter outer membrane factor (OMF) lipoprotein